MTATYDRMGIRFLYPENWEIVDEMVDAWPRMVSVQSPTGAFWSIAIHPAPADADQLADEALQAMQEEYDDLETEPIREDIAGLDAGGYDLQFYCLNLVVSMRLRTFQLGDHAILLMYQGEDRDFDRLERVFGAITASLFRTEDPAVS